MIDPLFLWLSRSSVPFLFSTLQTPRSGLRDVRNGAPHVPDGASVYAGGGAEAVLKRWRSAPRARGLPCADADHCPPPPGPAAEKDSSFVTNSRRPRRLTQAALGARCGHKACGINNLNESFRNRSTLQRPATEVLRGADWKNHHNTLYRRKRSSYCCIDGRSLTVR